MCKTPIFTYSDGFVEPKFIDDPRLSSGGHDEVCSSLLNAKVICIFFINIITEKIVHCISKNKELRHQLSVALSKELEELRFTPHVDDEQLLEYIKKSSIRFK